MTLRTPSKGMADPIGLILGNLTVAGPHEPGPVQDGYIVSRNWNPELAGWRIDSSNYGARLMKTEPYTYVRDDVAGERTSDEKIRSMIDLWDVSIAAYGVCDSIEQFDADFGDIVRGSSTDLCVFFVHVPKDPSNRGRGGGWRWHKWGEYLGHGETTTEYLDDEDLFDDGVWTFHIYEVLS